MNDGPDNLQGERSVSAVASTATPWLTPGRKALLIGVGTVALLGFIYWKNPGQKKEEPAPAPPATGISQVVAYEPPKPVALPAPAVPPAPAAQAFTPPPQTAALPEPKAAFAPAKAAEKPRSRMLSFATTEQKDERANSRAAGGSDRGGAEGTQVRFKPSEIPGAQAGPAIDKTLVLMPGLIRCILDVEVDSQLSGPLMCHLPDPVLSDEGVVLMDKGSQIFGSYTSDVHQGQNRILSVSATGWTPFGVPVPLGGPFADSLGATGLPGSVDNHLLQRFGGAVLLTFVEGGLGIAQSAVSKGGNSYVSLNAGGGVGSLAQEVLRNTINIPPTIVKHQGDEVFIWVLQPIDFRPAYKLINR